MSYLLDTHTLLWWLADHPTLSEPARSVIANPHHLFDRMLIAQAFRNQLTIVTRDE